MRVIQVGDMAGVALSLTAGLRDRGVDARLVVMPKRGETAPAPQEGIDVISSPCRLATQAILAGRLLGGKYAGCDIYHAHALYNVPLMLLGKLDVAHFHGDDLLETARGSSPLSHLMRKAMRRTRRILVSTPDLVEAACGLGAKPEKITFLPNPVNVELFSPGEKAAFPGTGQAVKLFHPTRFQEKKHNERLFLAYRELQDKYPLSLYLVGGQAHSPDAGRMQALIERLELKRVHFLPPAGRKDMAGYYNAADIVLDQFEIAMGLVSLEAMACGKPVITACYRDGAGYEEKPPVFQVRTVDEIIEAISFLAGNRDHWPEIGNKARRWVEENHSTGQVIPKLMGVYEEVVNM
ncbi:MAG: glycosyltransferase family 4 protein [Gemmatimonadota bacterium]|nr:glycosyltransferase family 4 protein [Gemmatimonadota bacterium]